MKSFHELVMNRRSIRKYTDEPISGDDVKTILEAALMAPSSKRSMPWEFVVVEDREKLAEMAKCRALGTLPLTRCPLAILVTASSEVSDAWVEDGSIAAVFMQLQATDLGLGSCWVQVRNRFDESGEPAENIIRSIIDIPDEQHILCAIAIGHKDEERKPLDPEKCLWEKVHIAK